LVNIVDRDLWLRRRVCRHVFLQEVGDALGHMDARAFDSKLFAMRVLDIVENRAYSRASAISLDIVRERASDSDVSARPGSFR
jgi:hypothetical protein